MARRRSSAAVGWSAMAKPGAVAAGQAALAHARGQQVIAAAVIALLPHRAQVAGFGIELASIAAPAGGQHGSRQHRKGCGRQGNRIGLLHGLCLLS
jgi:hypothetical protein